jgi:hypothetical protein
MIWSQTLGLINSTENEINDSANQLFHGIIHFFRFAFHSINFNIAQFAAINSNATSYDTLFQSHSFILCDDNGVKTVNPSYLNPEESFTQFYIDITIILSNIMNNPRTDENQSLCQIGANIDEIVRIISDESSLFIQNDDHANNYFKRQLTIFISVNLSCMIILYIISWLFADLKVSSIFREDINHYLLQPNEVSQKSAEWIVKIPDDQKIKFSTSFRTDGRVFRFWLPFVAILSTLVIFIGIVITVIDLIESNSDFSKRVYWADLGKLVNCLISISSSWFSKFHIVIFP